MKGSTLPEVCTQEQPLPFDSIYTQLGFLKGKVLTVIDASFSDVTQRKAAKDLIHEAFRSQTEYIWEICGKPNRMPDPPR